LNPNEKFSLTLDYLFGGGVSLVIPINRLDFTFSKRTGKIKSVLLNKNLIATFRSDGNILLTIDGAELLMKHSDFKENCVVVNDEARDFVSKGRSVFAKHVTSCGNRIRPQSEVVILDTNGKVIAVGRALLSAKMMRQFKSGVAVKVRQSLKK